MPHESIDRNRTSGSLSQSVFAAGLLLLTASPHPTAVLDGEKAHRPPTHASSEATASDRLGSALRYDEVTGARLLRDAVVVESGAQIGSSEDPTADIRERIRSAMMEQNDAPDVRPPRPDAIADALRFVDLLPHDAPLPHMSVADDGEVNFFRRQSGLFVDIGFFGDGQIHYYARVESAGLDVHGSEPFGGRSLPSALILALTTA